MKTQQIKKARAWVRWLKQHIHDDKKGRYVAFSLITRYSEDKVIELIKERCKKKGVFVFLLPAISFAGTKHFHGLVRLPLVSLKGNRNWTVAEIREHDEPLPIRVPIVLYDCFWNRDTFNTGSTFGNLHLRHDGRLVDILTPHSFVARSVMAYWTKTTDGELRDFDEGRFVPHKHRTLLIPKIRKGSGIRRQGAARPTP